MIRQRKRKRITGAERIFKAPAMAPNQSCSIDFVADGLVDGRRIRCLNIVDDFTKQCLTIEVDHSMPRLRVVRILERLAEKRGLKLHLIEPGKPQQNANMRILAANSGMNA